MTTAVRILAWALAGAFSLGTAHADFTPRPLPDLGADMKPVLDEVQQMVDTNINDMPAFPVREATPARIEQLVARPGFTQLRPALRANALAFAGFGGPLLRLDKPSDIIAKVERWFPSEMAEERGQKGSRPFTSFLLYGPFPNWQPEPMAFMTLWNCMPRGAWIAPAQNPFLRRMSDGLPMMPVRATSSDDAEYDFGHCVHQRNGHSFPRNAAERQRVAEDQRQMAETVTPVLVSIFANHLQQQRCRGTGPDDCVMVLRLWSELTPADPALVAMIMDLERDIDPDAPLPPMQHPEADWMHSQEADGRERFDAALRRAAYLRVKLWSITHAPQAWPDEAVAATLRQLSALTQAYTIAYPQRYSWYQLGYYNNAINPWKVFSDAPEAADRLQHALLQEAARLGDTAPCDTLKPMLWHRAIEARHVLKRLRNHAPDPLRCGPPDMGWLALQEGTTHRDLFYGYLALLDYLPDEQRAALLTPLTSEGRACDTKNEAHWPASGWQGKVCGQWRHLPHSLTHPAPSE